MNFLDLVDDDCIHFIKSNSKLETIEELVGKISPDQLDLPHADIAGLLKKREALMSTGVGMGLGIPHARSKSVIKPVFLMGIKKDGIADYETIDGSEVKIVFLILLAEHQHKAHVEILSSIVKRMKTTGLMEAILQAENAAQILHLLKDNQ